MRKQHRGFALVSALASLMIIATLGLALAVIADFSIRSTAARKDSAEAFELAEGGLRHAIKSLTEDQTFGGQSATSFGRGTFSVTVKTPVGDSTKREIESTGRVDGVFGGSIKKTVKSVVSITNESTSGDVDYAIMSEELLEFSGNSLVNSNPTAKTGHIHSNGKLKISGDPLIDGEASVVGAYELSGGPTYTGGLHTASAPVAIPYPDFAALKTQASSAGTFNGDKIINGTQVATLKGVITGNLEINGNACVTIEGPLWVKGEANLKGNVQLKGAGIIITDGKLTLGGVGGFTADPTIDNQLRLASLMGPHDNVAVDLGGPVKIKAGIYAPNGKVNFSGQVDVWGFLRAMQVYISGDSRVMKNSNASEVSPQLKAVVKVVYWRE